MAEVPKDAQVKGMYFHGLRTGDPYTTRYTTFRDYPMVEFMRVAAKAARHQFPSMPLREGLRRIGWAAYETFGASMIGRVVLGIFDYDLDLIFAAGPKAYAVSISPTRVEATKVAPGHWRYRYSDCYNFLDSYHVGVIEGTIRHYDMLPDIRIRLGSATEGEFDIRWT